MEVWNFARNLTDTLVNFSKNLINIFSKTVGELFDSLANTESWLGSVIELIGDIVNSTPLGGMTLVELMFSSGFILLLLIGIYKFFTR